MKMHNTLYNTVSFSIGKKRATKQNLYHIREILTLMASFNIRVHSQHDYILEYMY